MNEFRNSQSILVSETELAKEHDWRYRTLNPLIARLRWKNPVRLIVQKPNPGGCCSSGMDPNPSESGVLPQPSQDVCEEHFSQSNTAKTTNSQIVIQSFKMRTRIESVQESQSKHEFRNSPSMLVSATELTKAEDSQILQWRAWGERLLYDGTKT